jgi:hypothetical protein
MKPKVILETSMVRNDKGFDQLLGRRNEIEKFAEKCDIILPSMVIDEIIYQKKKYFEVSKQNFTVGHLYKKLPPEIQVQIDTHLQFNDTALRSDQSIPYAVIDLQDKAAAFDEIRELAINHEAPFAIYKVEVGMNKTDNTDKGFKDAYIALTINQYVNSLPNNEKVFVLIRDRRFEENLDKNDRLVCVSSFSEFEARYQVTESRSATIQGTARIIPETRERQQIRTLLTEFRNTPNFASTHNLVIKLTKAFAANRLTNDDCLDTLVSTAQNNQISGILGDPDVMEFILPIFKKYGERLNIEQFNTIATGLGLEGKTTQPTASDIDFDDMDGMVDSWIELQSDIARGR